MKNQKYIFNDLYNLVSWHIENAINKKSKIYDLCVKYWYCGSDTTTEEKIILINYFNKH